MSVFSPDAIWLMRDMDSSLRWSDVFVWIEGAENRIVYVINKTR
jgi:hypothetical protein